MPACTGFILPAWSGTPRPRARLNVVRPSSKPTRAHWQAQAAGPEASSHAVVPGRPGISIQESRVSPVQLPWHQARPGTIAWHRSNAAIPRTAAPSGAGPTPSARTAIIAPLLRTIIGPSRQNSISVNYRYHGLFASHWRERDRQLLPLRAAPRQR